MNEKYQAFKKAVISPVSITSPIFHSSINVKLVDIGYRHYFLYGYENPKICTILQFSPTMNIVYHVANCAADPISIVTAVKYFRYV